MRLAYLILAHSNPNQLERLVNRLQDERNDIFIHLDTKAEDEQSFFRIAAYRGVFFISKRHDVRWGAFSMVKATLDSLNEIIGHGEYDYINLLSGSDYPIKSNSEIFHFFNKYYGREFLYYRRSPSPELPLGGCDRYEYYYDYDNVTTKWDNYETEMRQRNIRRSFLQGMAPYHGSQWWSLTGKCVEYVINKVRSDYEILNFYRYTKYPDEHFFQTIIMNSEFAAYTVNNNLRYIDWSCVNWNTVDWSSVLPHPKILGTDDFRRLKFSQALFARKFDQEVDLRVLDKIDSELLTNKSNRRMAVNGLR